MVFLLFKRWQAVSFPVATEELSRKCKTKHRVMNLQKGTYFFVAVKVNFSIGPVLAKMTRITVFMVRVFVITFGISLKLFT
jgi:hypothetical protein